MRDRLLLLGFALLALLVVFKVRFRPSPELVSAPQRGCRLDAGGEIPVLYLAGSPREKGRAHGRLLKDRIRAWVARLRPRDEGVAQFALETCGARMLPVLSAPLREELEGIAEGAGITIHEALYLSTRFELAEFRLVGGGVEQPPAFAEAAVVGPGPEVLRLFRPSDLDRLVDELVVIAHEDLDPPLVLVGFPGMLGGFAALRGGACAALRPMRTEARPILTGVAWPVLLRRLVESPPTPGGSLPAPATRAASVPMWRPDGEVGTLNLTPAGATWYAGWDGYAAATEQPVTGRDGLVAAGREDLGARAAAAGRARELVAEEPGPGLIALRIRGGHRAVEVLIRDGARQRREVVQFGR